MTNSLEKNGLDKRVIDSPVEKMSAEQIKKLLFQLDPKDRITKNPVDVMSPKMTRELKEKYVKIDKPVESLSPRPEMAEKVESVSETLTMESIEKDWAQSEFVEAGFPRPDEIDFVEAGRDLSAKNKGWKSWFKNAGEQLKNVGQKIKNFFFLPEEEKLTALKREDDKITIDSRLQTELKDQIRKEGQKEQEKYEKNSWVVRYPWLKNTLQKVEDMKASVEGFTVGVLIPAVSRIVLHDPILTSLAGGTTGMFLKFKLSQKFERAYYSVEQVNTVVEEKLKNNDILSVAACAAFLDKLASKNKILADKSDMQYFIQLRNGINNRLIDLLAKADSRDESCGIWVFQDKQGNKVIRSRVDISRLLEKDVQGMMFGMNAEDRARFEKRYSQGLLAGVLGNLATAVWGCSPQDQDHPGSKKDDTDNHLHQNKPTKIPKPEDIELDKHRIIKPTADSIFDRHDLKPFDLQERINSESTRIVAENTVTNSATVTPTPTENAGSGNHIYTTTDENGHKTYHSEGGYYGVKETDPNANTYNLKPTDPNSNLYHLKDSDPNTNEYHLDSKQDIKTQAGFHPFEPSSDNVKHDSFGNGDNNQPGMGGVNKNQDTDYGNAESDQSTSDQKPVLHHSTEGKKNFDEFLNEKPEYSGSIKPVVDEKPIDASKLFHTEKGLKNFQENWGSHPEGAKNQNNFEFNSDNSGNQPAGGEKSNNYDFAPYQPGSKPDNTVQQNNSEFNSYISESHLTDQVKTNNFEFAPYQSGNKPETPVQQNDSDFDSYTSSGSHPTDQVKSNNFEFSPYQQDGGQVPDLKENNATFETYQPSTQEKSNDSDFAPYQGE